MSESDIETEIKSRNSWLLIFVVVVLVTLFSWKVLDTPIRLDLTRFDFSDLLSLVLAIFAIALSVVFYLKASETSNTFYDNTYRFTKDVSEILGRIESGFGERLRHLDEGYTDQAHTVGAMSPSQTEVVKEEISSDQKQLEELKAERNNLVNEMLQKAQLEEHEKTQLLDALNMKDTKIADLATQLSHLQSSLAESESARESIACSR